MATGNTQCKAAIIGSGNIGTDLMIKIMRRGTHLEVAAMVGIDPASDGLARAARLGVATTHEGVEGLVRYLRDEAVDVLVDATHPFAAQMSRHALAAAEQAGVRRLVVVRPAWQAQPGDNWTDVPDMQAAAAALGREPRRVFLTVGQGELAPFAAAPWHDYLIRSIEPPDPLVLPPRARCIAARGPFAVAGERRLLEDEAVEVVVAKNSGGDATVAKLVAARALALPVVMVARPAAVAGPVAADAAGALAWLRAQAASPAERGE